MPLAISQEFLHHNLHHRFAQIQPFRRVKTLFSWVGKQLEMLDPILDRHMRVQLREDLAIVIEPGRRANIFRGAWTTTTGTTEGSGSAVRQRLATRFMTVDFPIPLGP